MSATRRRRRTVVAAIQWKKRYSSSGVAPFRRLELSNPLLSYALQAHYAILALPIQRATSADCKHRDRVGLSAAQHHAHDLEAYPCCDEVQKDGIPHPGLQQHRLAVRWASRLERSAAGETPDHRTFSSANRRLSSTN